MPLQSDSPDKGVTQAEITWHTMMKWMRYG